MKTFVTDKKPISSRALKAALYCAAAAGGLVCAAAAQAEIAAGPFAEGMHVVITGSGSAMPDPDRAGASAAVIVDGKVLQFDFGRGVMEGQIRAGINPLDVDYGFLTHLHFDHIASYDYVLYATWIAGRQSVMQVYGPAGTAAMHEGALRGMHAADYRFVQFIVDNWPPDQKVRPMREPPFEAHDSGAGTVLKTDEFTVTAISTPHYPYDQPSLAYRVDSRYGSVVISGDTGPSPQMVELAKGADILIHELTKPDPGMVSGGKFASKEFQKPTAERPQTGHTAPTELGRMAREAGVKMVIGYHVNPLNGSATMLDMTALYTGRKPAGPQIWAELIHAVKKEFDGPFVLAEDGMVFRVGSAAD